MKRFHDWQLRYEAFMRERRCVPFAWGSNDCAIFAADHVQAITGEKLCEELRGYQSEGEATRVLQEVGGMRVLLSEALGEPVRAVFARVGDLVLLREGAIAVCNGQTALAPGPNGVTAVSMSEAVLAWRVG